MSKHYCGMGSRKAPKDIREKMHQFGYTASKFDWILRSGGAAGCDNAIETGCHLGGGEREIYIPWQWWNASSSQLFKISQQAMQLAESIHPGWVYLDHQTRNLAGRDMHRILGQKLDIPTSFIICWTPDGCEYVDNITPETGGTALTIKAASLYNIPVFNIFNEGSYVKAINALK